MKGYSYPGKSPVKQKVDLTKTPVGPVAEKKPAKKEKAGDVDFKANFEGGEKVMKIQRDNNMKKRKVKNDARLAKANAEYEKGLAERISVNNPEHAKGAEGRIQALKNDHDVDDNGVPQTGAAEYYKKTGKKPKK